MKRVEKPSSKEPPTGKRNLSTFKDCIDDLEKRAAFPKEAPSLDPMFRGLTALGLDEKTIKEKVDGKLERIILVAGTNGKGTVCATLSTLLQSAGQSVGIYTSPHLVDYNERIARDGTSIFNDDFVTCYNSVWEKTQGIKLSHFEVLTLLAAEYFFNFDKTPDWVILEVGLGGLWDATNAIPHGTCVIGKIGFDHTHILGKSLSEIARNKFEIIRDSDEIKNIIHLPFQEELSDLVQEFKENRGGSWYSAPIVESEVRKNEEFPVWGLVSAEDFFPLSLLGKRAMENTSLALEVFRVIGFEPSVHYGALSQVEWPGRMEKVQTNRHTIFLSGDHNIQGVESLVEIVKEFKYKALRIVTGIGEHKDPDAFFGLLGQLPGARLYLTETTFRQVPLATYGSWLDRCEYSHRDPITALEKALSDFESGDMVLVTGSLYLVGDLRRHIFSIS